MGCKLVKRGLTHAWPPPPILPITTVINRRILNWWLPVEEGQAAIDTERDIFLTVEREMTDSGLSIE